MFSRHFLNIGLIRFISAIFIILCKAHSEMPLYKPSYNMNVKPTYTILGLYICLVIGSFFYNLSLEKGTGVNWIHERITYLSVMLLSSCTAFLVVFFVLLFSTTLTYKQKVFNFVVLVIWVTLLLIQDRGK